MPASNSLAGAGLPSTFNTAAIESATSLCATKQVIILALRVTIRHARRRRLPAWASRDSPATGYGLSNLLEQFLRIEWLGEKTEDAPLRGSNGIRNGAMRGRMITGRVGCWALITARGCMPSMPNMRKSVTTTVGRLIVICANAASRSRLSDL